LTMYLNSVNFYEVRPLTTQDFEQVQQLCLQTHKAPINKDQFATALDLHPELSLAVVREGAIVGYVLAGHENGKGIIQQLAIHPRYEDSSVAQTLLNMCIGKLTMAGIPRDRICF
jgi:ribosomal protein S18 acetylase RimI-like enzyme